MSGKAKGKKGKAATTGNKKAKKVNATKSAPKADKGKGKAKARGSSASEKQKGNKKKGGKKKVLPLV